MTQDVKFVANLGKTILQIAAQFADVGSAIYEYIINSLEYRESPDGCKILVSVTKDEVVISDNSMGMDKEYLNNFFTLSADNLARKGKQASWLKRGQFGTGKIAAFGIADELVVETVRNGKKNKYRITRDNILKSPQDSGEIPVEALIDDKPVDDPNGTIIYIKKLNVKVSTNEIIRKIEREISPYRDHDIQIAVNNHICEFKQLDIVNTYIFPSEGEVKERYGNFDLVINISRVPLDKFDQGVMIFSGKNRIAREDCQVTSKECGNLINGKVEINNFELAIDNVEPINQTRNLELNQNHKGAKELILFMGPKLEKVRKELLQKRNDERETLQSKKLTQLTNELSEKFNKQWNNLKKQLDEIRLGSNAKSVNSIFLEPGDDENLETLVFGEGVSVTTEENIRYGDSEHNQSVTSEPQSTLTESSEGSKEAKKVSAKQNTRRRAGFLVDHDSLGPDEQRSIYTKADLKIIINTDHPSVVACLKSCNGDVENLTFKRLIFEIAFREFEHAIGQEMISDNDLYPPSDLLFEMRTHYDKIARVLGPELYT